MAEGDNNKRPIIIKKVEEGHHGHHGGAWKVAYADFVTAMMAFFLLLWLLGSTTEEQRKGIADYFNPTVAVSSGPSGAGGVLGGVSISVKGSSAGTGTPMGMAGMPVGSAAAIGGMEDSEEENEETAQQPGRGPGDHQGDREDEARDRAPERPLSAAERAAAMRAADAAKAAEREEGPEAEERRFTAAGKALREALGSIPELQDIAQSVVVDRTPEGLRIQIVDQANYSLFPSGGSMMEARTARLLEQVTHAISSLPNKVSIRGHTDARPFAQGSGRDNWALSTERANATRMAMQAAGLNPSRIANVVGLADVEPFVAGDPMAPQNRRMSIVLLTGTKD
ncbi:flagellar motor protein MotB [Arenibaculum pallidiluteum]|uniref:flagellar motor protein MotB n=1 Tax=Arenibaculum pallidiluteum TaxID=2812559 RepID=UPI001A970554|nr:flagellar motor protein MotB [Arenibaculum pallidiluteum]